MVEKVRWNGYSQFNLFVMIIIIVITDANSSFLLMLNVSMLQALSNYHQSSLFSFLFHGIAQRMLSLSNFLSMIYVFFLGKCYAFPISGQAS